MMCCERSGGLRGVVSQMDDLILAGAYDRLGMYRKPVKKVVFSVADRGGFDAETDLRKEARADGK